MGSVQREFDMSIAGNSRRAGGTIRKSVGFRPYRVDGRDAVSD